MLFKAQKRHEPLHSLSEGSGLPVYKRMNSSHLCIYILVSIPREQDGYDNTHRGKQPHASFLYTANCLDSQTELCIAAFLVMSVN